MREIVLKNETDASYRELVEKARMLTDYEVIKDSLFIRPLNADKEKDSLTYGICRQVGDIILVLSLFLGKRQGGVLSTRVKKEYLQKWGLDAEEVMDAALENTLRMEKARIYRLQDLIYNIVRGEEYNGLDVLTMEEHMISKDELGNCLSTEGRTNGAVAIFLPGVAKRLGELLGDDYYLVFTSVHEVMVHKADCVKQEDLLTVLTDVLRTSTPPEDILTERIYKYSRERGEINCLASMEVLKNVYRRVDERFFEPNAGISVEKTER